MRPVDRDTMTWLLAPTTPTPDSGRDRREATATIHPARANARRRLPLHSSAYLLRIGRAHRFVHYFREESRSISRGNSCRIGRGRTHVRLHAERAHRARPDRGWNAQRVAHFRTSVAQTSTGASAPDQYVQRMRDRLEYRFTPRLRRNAAGTIELVLTPPPGFPRDGGIPAAVEATRRLTEARTGGWRRRYVDRALDVMPLPWYPTCAPCELAFAWINMLRMYARAPIVGFFG